MNTFKCFAAVALLGLCGTAGAQISIPNPGAPGASIETAVRILAPSDMMIDRFIKRWLRTHYPGWDADPHEFMQIGDERYAVVYITSPDNPGRRVYFRVARSEREEKEGDGSFPL
jgi:hypothetical protein